MTLADLKAYLSSRIEEMQQAQDRGDHAAILAVIDRIDADGHHDMAQTIRDNLADQRQHGAWDTADD